MAEQSQEESPELLPEDAVDDEVGRRVDVDEEVAEVSEQCHSTVVDDGSFPTSVE